MGLDWTPKWVNIGCLFTLPVQVSQFVLLILCSYAALYVIVGQIDLMPNNWTFLTGW
jgi:hypothetical protein